MKRRESPVEISVTTIAMFGCILLLCLFLLYQHYEQKRKVTFAEQETKTLQTDLENRALEIETALSEKLRVEKSLETLTVLNTAKIDNLEEEIRSAQRENLDLQKTKTNLESIKQELHDSLVTSENKVQILEGEIDFLNQKVLKMEETLNDDNAENQEMIETLEDQKSNLEMMMAELESKKEEIHDSLIGMEDKVQILEGEVKFLNQHVSETEERLKKSNAEKQEIINLLENRNRNLQEDKAIMSKNLQFINQELVGLEEDLIIRDQKISLLLADVERSDTKKDALERKIKLLSIEILKQEDGLKDKDQIIQILDEKIISLKEIHKGKIEVLIKDYETAKIMIESQRELIEKLMKERRVTIRNGDTIWDLFIKIHRFFPTWKQIKVIAERNDLFYYLSKDEGRLIVLIYPGQKIDLFLY